MGKITSDAATAMVRMLSDYKLYNVMMSRDTNFRYSDLSSIFRNPFTWKYIKRMFAKGDDCIPEKIVREKPILHLTTHELLYISEPVFSGLGDRLTFIEVVRHPLYMLVQNKLNYDRWTNNPRDINIYFEQDRSIHPFCEFEIEELCRRANSTEKAIFAMENIFRRAANNRKIMKEKYSAEILTIPFEKFVLDPHVFIAQIERLLGTSVTAKTRQIMKRENIPRKKIADGIDLPAYKRCGWEPGEKGKNEMDELRKRRNFAVENGAGEQALKVLDAMSNDYEREFGLGPIVS